MNDNMNPRLIKAVVDALIYLLSKAAPDATMHRRLDPCQCRVCILVRDLNSASGRPT